MTDCWPLQYQHYVKSTIHFYKLTQMLILSIDVYCPHIRSFVRSQCPRWSPMCVRVFINNGCWCLGTGHWRLCNCHILRGRHAQPRQNWQLQKMWTLYENEMSSIQKRNETADINYGFGPNSYSFKNRQAARVSLWLFYAFIWFTLNLWCASSINRKAN
mgnify:CR=1 FL=1